MKFTKEFLVEEGGTTIYDKIIKHSRWSVDHERVFEMDGKFYVTHYSDPATESQDERRYEYEPNQIECSEVFPREVVTVIYEVSS